MTKSEQRKKAKKIREELAFRYEKNCKITDNVLKLLQGRKIASLFLYVSLPGEVSTVELCNKLFGSVDIYVPHVTREDMIAVKLDSPSRFNKVDKRGNVYSSGELESIRITQSPDVVIVPMLAFNSERYRLGYGGGYYDRYLACSQAITIGVAFDEQLDENITVESHDARLDVIVTPTKVYGGVENGK